MKKSRTFSRFCETKQYSCPQNTTYIYELLEKTLLSKPILEIKKVPKPVSGRIQRKVTRASRNCANCFNNRKSEVQRKCQMDEIGDLV